MTILSFSRVFDIRYLILYRISGFVKRWAYCRLISLDDRISILMT